MFGIIVNADSLKLNPDKPYVIKKWPRSNSISEEVSQNCFIIHAFYQKDSQNC